MSLNVCGLADRAGSERGEKMKIVGQRGLVRLLHQIRTAQRLEEARKTRRKSVAADLFKVALGWAFAWL
jgi:hypothetical protein